MKVIDLIRLFDQYQDVEIYPTCNPKYPNEFAGLEDVNENKPIYQGLINDIPYYITQCYLDYDIDPLVAGPIIDCRTKGNLTTLVFSIKEDLSY